MLPGREALREVSHRTVAGASVLGDQTPGFHLSSALPFLESLVDYGGHTIGFLGVKWRK